MCEIKWFKVAANIFDDEKMKLIDSMEERDALNYIWIRLLSQAAKTNGAGFIYMSEGKGYSLEMLSVLFNRPCHYIENALKVFVDFGMIEVMENNIIKIINWEKHQNVKEMDKIREQTRKRVAKYRSKKKREENDVTKSNVTVTEQNKKEKEEEDIDIEIEIDKEKYMEDEISNGSLEEDGDTAIENTEEGQALKEKSEDNECSEGAVRLLSYYEKMTGQVGVLNLGALNIAVLEYGEGAVKMAVDKALEANIVNMKYINGILRNWKASSFPEKNKGVMENAQCGSYKDGTEFTTVELKEPRSLTEEEWEESKNLI